MHAGSDAGTKMCEVLLNRFHCEIGQHNVKDASACIDFAQTRMIWGFYQSSSNKYTKEPIQH